MVISGKRANERSADAARQRAALRRGVVRRSNKSQKQQTPAAWTTTLQHRLWRAWQQNGVIAALRAVAQRGLAVTKPKAGRKYL